MTSNIDASLLAWVDLPGPSKVITEVRRRLEQRGTVSGEINVSLSDGERREVGRLLGIRWVTSGASIRAAALEKALATRSANLKILAETRGPLGDLREEKLKREAEKRAEIDEAVRTLVTADVPQAVAQWFVKLRGRPRAGSGRLKHQAEQLAAIWRQLPEPDQPVSLAVFAADTLDDPHALDKDRDLGRALAVLIAATTAFHENSDTNLSASVIPGVITSSETWRTTWASRGVVCDQVSSIVLCLNLRLTGSAPAAAIATAAASLGEPVWLTHRSLHGNWSPTPEANSIYVCENPAVVEAAADRYGSSCAPLVCTYGWPSSAALALISGLERCGAQLHLRADDDAAGQKIVALLKDHAPKSRLWRYELQSDDQRGSTQEYEEQVLPQLLQDLSPTP
ncbi:TIGR02679 domain-containing protein [Streptomyces phaeochromogenes]